MTFNDPVMNITNNIDYIVTYSGTSPMSIDKRTNSPTTEFTIDKLVYTQYREDPVNDVAVHTGCGNIVYTSEFPGTWDNPEASDLVYASPINDNTSGSFLLYNMFAEIDIGMEG